jgi:hypothetical protein
MTRYQQKISLALSFIVIILGDSFGQNVTSPYSILGIGDVDTKDFGKYFGSGNASLARRESNFYNFSNPASLTNLPFKTMHLDLVARGRFSKYAYPNADSSIGIPSNDFVVKRITMAFKVEKKTAFAFGLRPYSSVNYSYLEDNTFLDGNTSYFKQVEGNGGINQAYFSLAKEVGRGISVGFTASWLFGTLERTTKYISPSIALNINRKEQDFYTGAHLQGGVQVYSKPGKSWRHQLGLVTSISTNLQGELTTEYDDGFSSIKKIVETGRSFSLPLTIGIGYSLAKSDKITFSIDGNYYHWKYQKVNYLNSYTNPSFRASAGFDFKFFKNLGSAKIEKAYISAGMNIENSYLRIRNNTLWDYSFSAGFGKNVSHLFSIYSGIEFGERGRKDYNQVTETYTQFIIGITMKNIWIGPKYTGRYN